jgi:predicted porin
MVSESGFRVRTPSAALPASAPGNRLGFKGEEALGNGLKAVFTLEYGLDPDRQLRASAPAG